MNLNDELAAREVARAAARKALRKHVNRTNRQTGRTMTENERKEWLRNATRGLLRKVGL
jgi:hypothetical protein